VTNVIDELRAVEERSRQGADSLEREKVKHGLQAIMATVEAFDRSWSRSWLGYQARVYYGDFEPVPPGAEFSVEWGLKGPSSLTRTRGEWREYAYQSVCDEVFRRAGNPDLEVLKATSAEMASVFEACQQDALAILDAALAEDPDKRLQELRDEVAKTKPSSSEDDIAGSLMPTGRYVSQDWRALEGGITVPPHLAVKSRMMTLYSGGAALTAISKSAKQARLYLEKRMNLRRAGTASADGMAIAPSSLEVVEKIIRRFHHVAMQLRRRHDNRKTLEITDEYDVQDLLHALLHVHFPDIRREETGPSLAGARPRVDFLLKGEQIFIEVKKTRASLTPSALTQELLADIPLYKGHPDCKTLICFVYDPDRVVMNPGGFVQDLEQRSSPEMTVRVLVVPH
jgi:hypothetical protein